MPLYLLHATTERAASTIISNGFRDATDCYGLDGVELTGVWVSDLPVGTGSGARGDALLEVLLDASEGDLAAYEVDVDAAEHSDPAREAMPREWCVPASLLNTRGSTRRLTGDEAEDVEIITRLALTDQALLLAIDPRLVSWLQARGFTPTVHSSAT